MATSLRRGIDYGLLGAVLGILYEVFIPLIVKGWHLPIWFTALFTVLLLGGITGVGFLSDWSAFLRNGIFFIGGTLVIAWAVSDTIEIIVGVVAIVILLLRFLAALSSA